MVRVGEDHTVWKNGNFHVEKRSKGWKNDMVKMEKTIKVASPQLTDKSNFHLFFHIKIPCQIFIIKFACQISRPLPHKNKKRKRLSFRIVLLLCFQKRQLRLAITLYCTTLNLYFCNCCDTSFNKSLSDYCSL